MHARKSINLSVSPAIWTKTSNGLLSPGTNAHRSFLSPSPPPSPGLPSLLPRHGKKLCTISFWRFRRPFTALLTLLFVTWLAVHFLHFDRESVQSPRGDTKYEMVGDDSLPTEPSAVIVTDNRGKRRWTVSIPANHDFPLRPVRYQEIYAQATEISNHLAESAKALPSRHRSYYQVDPYFMDVQEAEEQGLLPHSTADGVHEEPETVGRPKVCDRSLTYVLETSEAGIGQTLIDLWMSYGLAQKEGRAFFIDDKRWPYGTYTSFFALPPQPSCLPPPRSHILPHPHHARHLLISAATSPWTFGPSFLEEFSDGRKTGARRQRRIFDLLRTGYDALFQLADAGDAKYVEERAASLYDGVREKGGTSVGVHVRRGDRHPWEYQYERDYLPLERFAEEARAVLARRSGGKAGVSGLKQWTWGKSSPARLFDGGQDTSPAATPPGSQIVLASDDPDIYTHPEMGQAVRAQDRIVLASKATLEAAAAGQPKANKFLDEVSGWEGGFFRDVFWGLGQPRGYKKPVASPAPSGVAAEGKSEEEAPVPEQAMKMRELVARAYLLDLAVLARADAVVCAVSAAGCRILAVMMGWERAVEEGRWRNVDGGFAWRGV